MTSRSWRNIFFVASGFPRFRCRQNRSPFCNRRPWAGNVRELRNAIEHAGIVSRGGQILPEHFPPPIRTGGSETIGQRIGNLVHDWVKEQVQAAGTNEPAYLYDELLKVVEPALLDEVLRQLNGNRLATAALAWIGLRHAAENDAKISTGFRDRLGYVGSGQWSENTQNWQCFLS